MAEHIHATYRVSVKALIRDEDGKILLNCENGHDGYSLPGGGIDHGESVQEALRRELFEELAVTKPVEAKLRTTIPFYSEYSDRWMIWVVFDVQCKPGDVGIGEDSESIEWVSVEEIDETTTSGKLIKSMLQ